VAGVDLRNNHSFVGVGFGESFKHLFFPFPYQPIYDHKNVIAQINSEQKK